MSDEHSKRVDDFMELLPNLQLSDALAIIDAAERKIEQALETDLKKMSESLHVCESRMKEFHEFRRRHNAPTPMIGETKSVRTYQG